MTETAVSRGSPGTRAQLDEYRYASADPLPKNFGPQLRRLVYTNPTGEGKMEIPGS